VTEGEKKLWLENIQLRQQAHYYQSLHERALAKQSEQAAQIQVLQAKVAELQKRLWLRRGAPAERRPGSRALNPQGSVEPGHDRRDAAAQIQVSGALAADLGDGERLRFELESGHGVRPTLRPRSATGGPSPAADDFHGTLNAFNAPNRVSPGLS
jgi:hypothetical protein